MEIDIFFEQLKIAVEYHGKQHYEAVKYFGREAALKAQIHRDGIKKDLVRKNSNKVKHFIIFSYMDDIDEDSVKKKLEEVLSGED